MKQPLDPLAHHNTIKFSFRDWEGTPEISNALGDKRVLMTDIHLEVVFCKGQAGWMKRKEVEKALRKYVLDRVARLVAGKLDHPPV